MQAKNNLEKKLQLQIPSPLNAIKLIDRDDSNINFYIKRDDQIHKIVSGNKWRKLKYNFENVIQKEIKQIISFGGAWSNHLHALSWCCKQLEIELVVFIRGEENETPSAMIQDLIKWGTKIKWLDRNQYRQKSNSEWLSKLALKYPNAEIIPEGGSNHFAINGVAELASEIQHQTSKVDYLCLAVGSGGTIAGIIDQYAQTKTQVIGIPVLKGAENLKTKIKQLVGRTVDSWQLFSGYEFGGYAKYDDKIAEYIANFYHQQNILLEPIYTAKLMKAVEDLHHKKFFKPGSNVVVIHSGGLQGIRGDRKFNLPALLENN